MGQPVFIDRPPRVQPELPFEQIEIPDPPQKQDNGILQLLQVGLPMITIVGTILATVLAGSGRGSAMMVVPMALSVVASVGIAVYTHLKEKKDWAAAERAYMERLIELSKDMRHYHDLQRRFYSYNYPDRQTVFRIVKDARWEVEKERRTLRADTRLWERRTDDDDFGAVRLGMGTLPSTVVYLLRNQENFGDPMVRAALKLQEDSKYVSDIPVIISLRKTTSDEDEEKKKEEKESRPEEKEEEEVPRTPVTHAMGIAGERASVYEFVRSLLGGLVAFHAPMDIRLYVLATHRQEWAWTDDVPHCQDDETTQYRFFIDSGKESADERGRLEEEETPLGRYLEGVRKVLSQRRLQLAETDENEGKGDPTLPLLVLVVDLLDAAYDENSPLRDLESDAAISILLEEGSALGAAVIFLVPERAKVPGGCKSVLEIEKTTPATNTRSLEFQKLHFRYAETGVNTFRYVGEADLIKTPDEIADLSRRLAELDVHQSFGAGIVSVVPFMQLMGYNSMQALEADAWRRWQETAEAGRADWLRAKIGLMSGNKPRTLVFSAKRDGVHGMVAGSTGSGKSELLISLITGMSVTYDPTVVNFVLVDYKGGGAFKGFDDLPHCVDIITNLGSEGVTRMFTAINAEMQRRQKLNTDTGTKNIVDYRQKGLHKTHAPYPFLFIIIDEFAEMIADRAEYKAQLEMITRVGRAQGVSLILAAQRPSGVTDQMRSNIKFRICLRVETSAESRELLRRTDAAFLPGGIPGRGFLQVGNEEIELIQSAYTGDKYIDPNRQPRAAVIWPDRGDVYDPTKDQEPPELYRAIVATLSRMQRDHGVAEQTAPWPDFLPTRLSLSTVLLSQDPSIPALTAPRYLGGQDVANMLLGVAQDHIVSLNRAVSHWLNDGRGWVEPLDWERYALRPVVGLLDNPYAAKQMPLIVDLPRGHAVVFGASGWGKTTFIRSLVVSLAATHSPSDAHIYILDLGGRNLGVLEKLPHVGAVINADEEGYKERVEQLLREIDGIVDKRKTILSSAGLPDIYKYNASHPDDQLAGIVVAVDNFAEFKETFGGGNDDVETVLTHFTTLAREAKPYGIHFIITAGQVGLVSGTLLNLFTERFTFKLADATEYREVTGTRVDEIPDIPGRGYTKVDRLPLSFQTAMPIELGRSGAADVGNENRELERMAQNMRDFMARAGRPYRGPVMIGALPKSVLFKQILARQHGLALDETFRDRLKEIARQQWADSTLAEKADWLKVTIGLASGNRLRLMELEAKKDGVHGLIAGGTGSGKSELLMTMICGLALNYDPSILNFVLVDYKGGGAFKPFENLPHVVDTITNLNKAAVRRMFTAINAEMMRRQKLSADTGTKDIVEYRAKGYHLTREPFPHLFIIIDEYAEMISDTPEFKNELDSITRVGRSAGVNLILASQRPIGVTDQMRANIKFRICLRVEGMDTSRELLRRPDAALLPNGMPGRGYLQVGNEGIELMQVAYTGENYPYATVPEGGRQPKFYDVIVDLSNELMRTRRPRTPWPPFLPRAMTLADPLVEDYLDKAYQPLITLGRTAKLNLNPFVQDWLDGRGAWYGVDWGKQAMRGIPGLLDNPYDAHQLPLVVDFTKGHAVMFGASGWGKTTFLRSLILSLAATHSPDEFQAHVLDLGGRNLEVLRALPNVGTVIMPDERGYEERVQQLLRELNDVVDYRKRLFSEAGTSTLPEFNSANPDKMQPALLVAIDNFAEFIETFGGEGKDKKEENSLLEALVALVRQSKAYGVHFVITASRLAVLSGKLLSLFTERLTLRLSDAEDYSGILGARVDEVEEIQGRGYTRVDRQPLAFQIALPPGTVDSLGQVRGEAAQIRAIGQKMNEYMAASAHKYSEPLRIDALPKTSSYRQVVAEEFGIGPDRPFMEQLKTAVAQRWEYNASAEHADWLQVILGITSGNRKRALRMEAKRDGVHGLVAGGTGSGKSELLMTMIVGLALNYPPDILNFVLVDYKGGGAFKPFERLPHCVDIVTNLNKSAVDRMFTAINAEIRRRQKLNADTGTKDIIEYRRKGLHKTREPYPHLFVIIDEYSEMIDDNPEYKAELESITRVGRSQGVNLILASQRPKGVTDQMRANIKFRICLRVEQTDASLEMLRRPDAAFLPNGMPGRGYLQVGNENLELVQVSYTGEPQPDDRDDPVLWPDRPAAARAPASEDVPRLYDAAVAIAWELNGGKMARRPWPAFLSTRLSLQSPIYDGQRDRWLMLNQAVTDWLNGEPLGLYGGVGWQDDAMRAVVGIVDQASEARQFPLEFHLARNHLVVLGDSGWGKTSLLRSIIVSLTSTHTPDELHVHVLDLGGRNYRSLADLPHMGAVIYADEDSFEERVQRLFDMLNRTADERMRVFSTEGAANLYEYNQRYPDRALPAVLVIIDNFAPLVENYEGFVDAVIGPLVRRSLATGITFISAANVPNNMPSKLYALFGEQVTFKQTNTDRYLDIVGRGALEIDDIAGRGYIRIERRPLLFQAALPVGALPGPGGRDVRVEADELALMAQNMRAFMESGQIAWRSKPDHIDILPELVPLTRLLERVPPPRPNRIEAVLGLSVDLQPALYDLKRMAPHLLVVGPPLSGKTTTLYTHILSLAQRYPPSQIMMVLVDLQRRFMEYGGKHRLDELPHVIATVSEVEQFPALLPSLKNEATLLADSDPPRELFIFIDNFDDFSEEVDSVRDLQADLATLARRYGREGLHYVIAAGPEFGSSDLKRRIQSANLGIGLRNAAAVEALRVVRTPAGFRGGRELALGRGYKVRSGQATMLQVATPYEGIAICGPDGLPLDESLITEDTRLPLALDAWVEAILARYPDQRAAWSAAAQPQPGGAGAAAAAVVAAPAPDGKASRFLGLLRRAMLWETDCLKQGTGMEPFVTASLARADASRWGDQGTAMPILKEVWLHAKKSQGLPEEMVQSLLGVMDDESLLMDMESSLPEPGADQGPQN